MTVWTNIIKSAFSYFWQRTDTWESLTETWDYYHNFTDTFTNIDVSDTSS